MSFWPEDHVEPFLLGKAPTKGELIHSGLGIRDSAGPQAVVPGVRVLPYDREDDGRGQHQDVAGREPTPGDGRRATVRPLPPPPTNHSGRTKTTSQVRIPISNYTKRKWRKIKDADIKAKEIIWARIDSNSLQRARDYGRVLPVEEAEDCWQQYLKRQSEKAASYALHPELGELFSKDESDTPPSLPSNQPPSKSVDMRKRLGPKLTVHQRLGPKTTDAENPVDSSSDAGEPIDKARPRPNDPSAKILACQAAAKARAAKHQDLVTPPSDKVMACKLAARKRQQERPWNAPRNPPKRRREETYGKQTGKVCIEFGGTSIQLRNQRRGGTHGKRVGGIFVEFGGMSVQLKKPFHDMIGYSIRHSLKGKDNK